MHPSRESERRNPARRRKRCIKSGGPGHIPEWRDLHPKETQPPATALYVNMESHAPTWLREAINAEAARPAGEDGLFGEAVAYADTFYSLEAPLDRVDFGVDYGGTRQRSMFPVLPHDVERSIIRALGRNFDMERRGWQLYAGTLFYGSRIVRHLYLASRLTLTTIRAVTNHYMLVHVDRPDNPDRYHPDPFGVVMRRVLEGAGLRAPFNWPCDSPPTSHYDIDRDEYHRACRRHATLPGEILYRRAATCPPEQIYFPMDIRLFTGHDEPDVKERMEEEEDAVKKAQRLAAAVARQRVIEQWNALWNKMSIDRRICVRESLWKLIDPFEIKEADMEAALALAAAEHEADEEEEEEASHATVPGN